MLLYFCARFSEDPRMNHRSIALGLLLWSFGVATAQDPQRHLEFKISGTAGDTVFLANYYGNRLFYADTAIADPKGRSLFDRTKGYPAGVYAVVIPGPKYFEFIINEPEVQMSSDKDDLQGKLAVERSVENKVFLEYIRMLNDRKKEADILLEKRKLAKDPIARASIQQLLDAIDGAMKLAQQAVVDANPGTLVAQIVRMSQPVDRSVVHRADGTLDSLASYYDYRARYWMHTDLSDERIVRTPVFQNKLEEYIGRVVPQIPDTINRLADEFIGKLPHGGELFKFVVHNITYKYETSDIMGMDAVFVHMALTYYCPEPGDKSKATWMSEEKLDKMCERARKQAPLVIGAKAKHLVLPDTTEQKWISSHTLPNDFLYLIFWDPHCGHCKKELPGIYKDYVEKLKPMGVEVYSVAKATDSTLFADWKKFIRENHLDWVNVGLTWHVYQEARKNPSAYIPRHTNIESLNYADTYDVYSTPRYFLLDADRKIAGKQITAGQAADLVTKLRERKMNGGSKP